MAKKNFCAQDNAKQALGNMISRLRQAQNMSLRKFAKAINLPPSNVTYIEKGVNAPSPEVYARIIQVLSPEEHEHQDMDMCYSKVRNLPPPDVCDILLKMPELNEKLKLLNDVKLSPTQLKSIETLFSTFKV